MSALRKILVLVCVVALVSGPVRGVTGGGEGMINLPGGCAMTAQPGGGGGSGSGFVPVARSIAEDLRLVLPANMASTGAVAVTIRPGNAQVLAVSSTTNGSYTITAADMKKLIDAGVKEIVLDFVSTNELWLQVKIAFVENQQVVITVP